MPGPASLELDLTSVAGLHVYDGLEDAAGRAADYRASGMRWFQPIHVWDELDSNLVPIVTYNFGRFQNPVTSSQTALAFHGRYLDTGADEDLRGFLNNAEWLMANVGDDHYFHYRFPYRHAIRYLDVGFVSGMAQGEALTVLSTAYDLTGEARFLDTARGLFETLRRNMAGYWCIGVDEDGYYWIEEYPNDDFCHVLNGYLFGLWGLWAYYVVSGEALALDLFKAGIQTFLDHRDRWNVPGENLSRYCGHDYDGNPKYHEIHLTQLAGYADLLGIPEFREAAEAYAATSP